MNATFITSGLIHRYMQNGSQLEDFLKKYFSKGATPREVLYDKNCTLEIAHALARYISLDSEEYQIYLDFCHINGGDPSTIFDSDDIVECKHVIGSKNITRSTTVRFSHDVSNSQVVYSSNNITHSKYVFRSSFLTDCEYIINSNSCDNSDQLVGCDEVQWTSCAQNSKNVDECRMIFNCRDVTRCEWSFALKNCTNCLFCAGLEGANLKIFNQDVDAGEFEQYYNYLSDCAGWDNAHALDIESKNGLYTFVPFKTPKDFFNKNLNGFEEIKDWPQFNNEVFGWNFFEVKN